MGDTSTPPSKHNEILPPLNIKIKQEKITPPSSPKSSTTGNIVLKAEKDAIDPNLDYVNTSKDEKKSMEPIKSSNEILAELFQVFSAAPPEITDAASSSGKKKHKKDKKHKKHKRKGLDDDADGGDDKKVKLKKVKKEKKEKEHRKKESPIVEAPIKYTDLIVKKERGEKRRVTTILFEDDGHKKPRKHRRDKDSKETQDRGVKDDLDIAKYEKELIDEQKEKEKTSSASTKPGSKGKIVIKSLKHSAVYEEAVKEVQARESERAKKKADKLDEGELSDSNKSRQSELSLSDEDTYNRERTRYYGKEDRDRSTSYYGRDRYEFYGSDRDRRRRGRYDRSSSRDRRRYDDDYRRRRSESRSRRRDNSEDRIDKKRLLEIARKNAIYMLKNGTLPGTQNMAPEAKEKVLAKMRYGGKSVDELTEFCKKLSSGEASGYLSNVSDDSEHDGEGNERAFNHPFVLKDKGPIVMNIRNSVPIPPKTAEQTKAILMQFPVSSGQHHRLNESEWVPVTPQKKPAAIKAPPPPTQPVAMQKTDHPAPHLLAIEPAPLISAPASTSTPTATVAQQAAPPPPESVTNIFPDTNAGASLDVTSIITKRLNAMRKLQENPLDSEALKLMYNTQKDMSSWANSKFVPGQFTGSTGAHILSARELTSGFQAWAKRILFLTII